MTSAGMFFHGSGFVRAIRISKSAKAEFSACSEMLPHVLYGVAVAPTARRAQNMARTRSVSLSLERGYEETHW